ncbi:WW domain containing protein [Nitzschia inconspicua]|uniref:WW domain containing protein n=1 Tax=Nitzschia inconspicua TaxID=303405 RepID=A0A9K3LN80_9STRA|nr:WW domain containing protein [Nitzschia inconspicua]
MGSKMSNPLMAVLNLLFGPSTATIGKKRHLEQQSHNNNNANNGGVVVVDDDDDDENDRWIQDYDEKRRRIYYYNPKLQEISWKMPTGSSQPNMTLRNRKAAALPNVGTLPSNSQSNSEWCIAYDRTNGLPYYYNPKTQESKWELVEQERHSYNVNNNNCIIVVVEYNGSNGVIIIPVRASATYNFAMIREDVMQQLDDDMRPEDSTDWCFQLYQPNDVIVSRKQESSVDFLQTFLRQQNPLLVKLLERSTTDMTASSNDGYDNNADDDNGDDDDTRKRTSDTDSVKDPSTSPRGDDTNTGSQQEDTGRQGSRHRRSASATSMPDQRQYGNPATSSSSARPPLSVPKLSTPRGQNSTTLGSTTTANVAASSARQSPSTPAASPVVTIPTNTAATTTTTTGRSRPPPPPPPPPLLPPPTITKRAISTTRQQTKSRPSNNNNNGSDKRSTVDDLDQQDTGFYEWTSL